jgi:type I restriction enzyme, S subunit
MLKARNEFVSAMQFVTNNFDSLYDNIENVKELRQAILTLAVQGKLVPQDPSDEPASVLLEKIQKEKERLIERREI